MTSLPKPTAILFDWDGTLVDSLEAVCIAMNTMRTHFGDPLLPHKEVISAISAGTAKDIFRTWYPNNEDKAKQAVDIYYSNIPSIRATHVAFFEGARNFLDDIRARGIPMGIVSNMNHPHLVAELTHVGVEEYFAAIVGAGEAARGKPSPDPIYLALERIGISRTQANTVWFVGDMETDQKAARTAGCPFLCYVGGHDMGLKSSYTFDKYDVLKADLDKVFAS